jgi:hypothetical protein
MDDTFDVPVDDAPVDDQRMEEKPPGGDAQPYKEANLFKLFELIQDPFEESSFQAAVTKHFEAAEIHFGVQNYEILYLFDRDSELGTWHQNRIYRAASQQHNKPILLLIDSLGGRVEPGYLISKTCKRLAKDRFVVAVPRQAKSAATLLSLGADEIHMGLMSELGPIDPQFGGFPALGMKNALEILADLACRYPGASSMLAEFLKNNLDMRSLGYYERINESARQYAERLLANKPLPQGMSAQSLADHFVNHYKDHSFVIDADEAARMLGNDIVKQGTNEYYFANEIFEAFDLLRIMLRYRLNVGLDLIGKANDIRTFPLNK